MKTAIINNLSSNKNLASNCEDDNSQLIVNLKEFLQKKAHKNVVIDSNELLQIHNVVVSSDLFESETTAYVCGFFMKKLQLNCTHCRSSFKSENVEQFHTLISFKEHESMNLKLNYCSKDLIICVTHIYDLLKKSLDEFPHIINIRKKMKEMLFKHVDTSFISCEMHKNEITNKFFDIVIKCIICKFVQDKQRHYVATSRSKYKKLLHL